MKSYFTKVGRSGHIVTLKQHRPHSMEKRAGIAACHDVFMQEEIDMTKHRIETALGKIDRAFDREQVICHVSGTAVKGTGVCGTSKSGTGVRGTSKSGTGVRGLSDRGVGVYGRGGELAGQFEGSVEISQHLGVDFVDVKRLLTADWAHIKTGVKINGADVATKADIAAINTRLNVLEKNIRSALLKLGIYWVP
ncbi:MAG: hypothetical protein ABIQ99_14220 [Thermoflexales bacterium]